MFKHQLGQVVKDIVTGFTGVIMSRTEYLTGCRQYGVQTQRLNKEGALRQWEWFDEDRIVPVKAAPVKLGEKKPNPGGPMPTQERY